MKRSFTKMEISTVSAVWYPNSAGTMMGTVTAKKFMKRDILCRCVKRYPSPTPVNTLVELAKITETFKMLIIEIVSWGEGDYVIPTGTEDIIGYLLKNNGSCVLHKITAIYKTLFIMSEFSTCFKCRTWFTRCKLCGETATWNDFNSALANVSNRFACLHDQGNSIFIKASGNDYMTHYSYKNYLTRNKPTVLITDPYEELAKEWILKKVPFGFRLEQHFVEQHRVVQHRVVQQNEIIMFRASSKMRGSEESYFVQISNKTGYEVVKIIYEYMVELIRNGLKIVVDRRARARDTELSMTVKNHLLHNCGFEYECMFCGDAYESFPSEEVYISHIEKCKKIQSPYFKGKKYYDETGSKDYDVFKAYLMRTDQ